MGHEIPPMPEGFTDRTAWDAIHWQFSGANEHGEISTLDGAVLDWQRENQNRVHAAESARRIQLEKDQDKEELHDFSNSL